MDITIYDLAVNIIIDWTDPTSPVFVEIETDDGESIRIGKTLPGVDGLSKLRITVGDIINHEKT